MSGLFTQAEYCLHLVNDGSCVEIHNLRICDYGQQPSPATARLSRHYFLE